MSRLMRVELRRYLARAGVRWLVVGMLVAVAMTAVAAYRATAAPSQAQLDGARQTYELNAEDWRQHGEEYLADCEAQEAANAGLDLGCDQMRAPELSMFLPYRATFAGAVAGWFEQVAVVVLLLALVVGATFVAAEFGTGAMSTWLTFEPRRGRVFASKAAVVSLATGVVVLVVGALAIGAFWAVCALQGSLGDGPPGWAGLAAGVGRAGAAGAGAALLGAALAFLLRHTAAAITVVVGWLLAVDTLLPTAYEGLRSWTLQLNLTAWLQGGTTYWVSTGCTPDAGGGMSCQGADRVLTMTHGGLTVLGLVAVVTVAALLVFRRRDVG